MSATTGRDEEIRRLLRACQQKRRELHAMEARLRELQIGPVGGSVKPLETPSIELETRA